MAIMCPSVPKEYKEASREGYIFDTLAGLPDDYYVFHSLTVVNINESGLEQHEGDFVVFNPQKGILCIEAKAGRVYHENGTWYYGNGLEMNHGGPFQQALVFKKTLMDKFRECGLEELIRKCKFLHAVWFPSIKRKYFDGVQLPAEADRRMMLFQDSEEDIEKEISEIFEIPIYSLRRTLLSRRDMDMILARVLAPKFDVISISQMKQDHNEMVFGRLLKEQTALLNYLEEQDRAVINGMAGTGKTLMAVEKAKRHAMAGDRVLFLCFNKYLKDRLREAFRIDGVDYYTIDGLACRLCNTKKPDFEAFAEKLEEYYFSGDFPYKHIIIDEGQHFGQDRIDERGIISFLQMLVLDNENIQGTFYIFYDKNQLIQGRKLPEYISEADCKLTLYRNCRNTANIASTSARLLGSDKKPRLKENSISGDAPEMYIATDKTTLLEAIDRSIDKNIENGITDMVILTCAAEETSILSDIVKDGAYIRNGVSYKFTTCRKFKGLEADAVILTDVDSGSFDTLGEKLTYVGTSRAKYRLSIVAELSEEECCEQLDRFGLKHGRKPKKSLAAALNAKFVDQEKKISVVV